MRVLQDTQADLRRRAAKILRTIDILWVHRRVPVNSDRNIDLLRDAMDAALQRKRRLVRLHSSKRILYLRHEIDNVRKGLPPREGLFEEVMLVLRWAAAFGERED